MLILMFSMPFASSIFIKQQAGHLIYKTIEELPEKNVALVLGAAAYPSYLSDALQDRMDTAIELYEVEKVQKLIMTGAPNEVEGMVSYALENGVEENDIIEDPEGINTLASMQNADHIKEMIIITQFYHLPRALFIARHFGIDAIGFASDKRSYTKLFEFKKRELLASTKAMLDLFVFAN
ncbi:vancomycin high temperature exclusion protein [candidate division KSB1 bacterium]